MFIDHLVVFLKIYCGALALVRRKRKFGKRGTHLMRAISLQTQHYGATLNIRYCNVNEFFLRASIINKLLHKQTEL